MAVVMEVEVVAGGVEEEGGVGWAISLTGIGLVHFVRGVYAGLTFR